MKKSDLLKQQRTAKLQAQKRIIDAAKNEKREFTEQEQSDLDAIDGEVESLDSQIEKAEKDEAREARIASLAGGNPAGEKEERDLDDVKKRFSFSKAMRQAAEGKLDGVEKEMNDEALREAKGLGLTFNDNRSFSIPAMMMRATQQTVTQDDGDFGAALVGTEIRPVDAFVPRLFLEDLGATFLTGLEGNVSLPVTGNYDLDWLNETEAVTLKAAEIEGPTLKPKRAAGGVAISNQLLAQSSISVEQMIVSKFQEGARRAIESAAINGDGVKAPRGLLNIPGVLTAESTTAAAPTWNDIVELPGLIEQADASGVSLGYLLDPKLASTLRTVTKDAGSGRFLMEQGLIDGTKTVISSLVPTLTDNHVLAYGDWSQMFVGQWGGANFVVDPYTRAGSGQVVVYINIYADVQVALPEAFAVNKFLTA